MTDLRNVKKEKNQHIQVFVRVRPPNSAEKVGKSFPVLELPSNKEVVVRERPQDKLSKKFTFDKVFGPSSKQVDVYNAVVNPLLDEVLAGYNCTVFAYGQTGTGKTFTMEGVSNDPTLHWQSDTTAGIIPRALSHLFDELRLLEAQEYTVRVSFLELYNEELFDLLSPSDDASKLRLYEDVSRKGSVIIHGLEEVTVHNKNEVYKILEKGSEKRQTAATLMNAHSSRSHTVFSITIHIKENNVDGEELLKTGKLNLVDLAGSENVGRSGAVDKRAREAGNINQSLLTLGRVITSLVERAPHIPYRESKLTRLLQESLGGRTKTSIIATVSPASVNLEETLSTLDYAHRAKNITNRPEINQKLSKKALLKEYTEEIERLRRDLLASRERNGVYLAQDNYNEMQSLIENQSKEIEEKITHIKVLKETMEAKERLFNEETNKLINTKDQLETTLQSTTALLQVREREKDEKCHLVEKLVSTEKKLLSQAETLLNVTDTAANDVQKLQDKISHKNKIDEENDYLSRQFKGNLTDQFQDFEDNVAICSRGLIDFYTSIKNDMEAQITMYKKDIDASIDHMTNYNNILNKEVSAVNDFITATTNSNDFYQEWLTTQTKHLTDMTELEHTFINNASLKVETLNEILQNEIANNLRLLSDKIFRKFDALLTYTKESIDQICESRQQEYNNFCQSMIAIEQNIQATCEDNVQIMREQEKLKKLNEDYNVQFNEINRNISEHHSNINSNLNRVTEIQKTARSTTIDYYDKNLERNKNLQEKIQNTLGTLKNDIGSSTKETYTAVDEITSRSHNVINKFETDIDNRRKIVTQNALCREQDMKEFDEKLKEHHCFITQSGENFSKTSNIVKEVSDEQMKMMEELKNKHAEISAGLTDKINDRNENLSQWNDKTVTELHSLQTGIEKFLFEDLKHDIPTGQTPAKREYSYPRRFARTSPHERIIQRFREARKCVDSSDDEDITLVNNNSPTEQFSNTN